MRANWLPASILGAMSTLLLAIPAEANQLESWRFDRRENRLTFSTENDVQPRAQLIPNPTRLVIDLPGTRLGSSLQSQPVGGAIREVRVGQFDSETTRIVIELNPGYTVDPQRVRVRGDSPTEWAVQLPAPQRTGDAELPPDRPISNGRAQLADIQVTADGFFLRTDGSVPRAEFQRSDNRRQVVLNLPNTVPTAELPRERTINRHGVQRLRISQNGGSRPSTRVTFELSSDSRDWRTVASSFGGVVVLPPRELIARPPVNEEPIPERPPARPPARPPVRPPVRPPINRDPIPSELATLEALELVNGESQLLIRLNQPVQFSSGWDRRSNLYQITINGTQLSDRLARLPLTSRSPVERVRLRQEDSETVVVQIQPAPGVELGDLNQINPEVLALPLMRRNVGSPNPGLPPNPGSGEIELPRVPNGQITVVIDPGHGGIDPGAIGIGGLREVDVLWPVSMEVTRLLEQQGIRVVLTRTDNRTVELQPRVQIAQRANADVFVSIHANAISMSRPDVNGTETFFASAEGRRLAQAIQSSMIQATGMRDRGVKSARFYVIRNTTMPAVLVELGFVTGAEDAPRLSDPAFRSRMAQAIVRGILQYVRQR